MAYDFQVGDKITAGWQRDAEFRPKKTGVVQRVLKKYCIVQLDGVREARKWYSETGAPYGRQPGMWVIRPQTKEHIRAIEAAKEKAGKDRQSRDAVDVRRQAFYDQVHHLGEEAKRQEGFVAVPVELLKEMVRAVNVGGWEP